MRCKPGDLAVVVRSYAGNEGKIVRCVRYAGLVNWRHSGRLPTWEIDQDLPGFGGHMSPFIADSQLRPIRDNDGEDETLAWAGKPGHVIVQWRHKIPAYQLPEWKL